MEEVVLYSLSFLSICWLFLVGYKMGYNRRDQEIVDALNAMIEEKTDEILEDVQNKSIARIEKIDDVFYLWDDDNGDFLAQGSDWAEIENALRIRFNGKKAVVVDAGEAKEIGLL